MKRLSAIAFALTALASSAVAQSIVVVDKDGNQHKYCTDYVQDITFEVVDSRPNYVFNSIDVAATPGNPWITFKTADGVTVVLDVYMENSTSNVLLDGTYTFGATTGNRVDISNANYTYYSPDGKATQAFKSGTMTVSHNAEAVYTISFEAVLADGSGIRGSYEGKINKMSPIVDIKLTAMKQADVNDPKDGQFQLNVNDADWKFDGVFNLYSGAGAKTVADGTYTLAETGAAMTYGKNTQITVYSPYAQLPITEPITVKTEAGVTTITTKVVEGDITYNITAEGAIEYLAPKTPEGVKYNMVISPWNASNLDIKFTADGEVPVTLDIYFDPKAEFLYEGVYNLGTSGSKYINNSPSNTSYTNVGGKAITAGSMVVSREGEEYTITFDFTYDTDKNIKGYYQGKLNDFGPVRNVEIAAVEAQDLDNLKDGEFYLKFHDNLWEYNGIIDLFCAAGATTIPDGTYTLGADNAAMTYSAKSEITAEYSHETYQFVRSITIGTEDGKRTVSATIVSDKGLTMNFTFKGDIKYVSK